MDTNSKFVCPKCGSSLKIQSSYSFTISANVNPNTGKPDNLQIGTVNYLNFSDEIECISCGALDPNSNAKINVYPIIKQFEVRIKIKKTAIQRQRLRNKNRNDRNKQN